MKVFGDAGYWTQSQYESVTQRIKDRTSLVLTSSWALMIFGLIFKLALWLAWFFYISVGAIPGFETLFITINSLIFAAVVIGVGADIGFWQVGWLGWSFFLRIIEALALTAAFIIEIIEMTQLTSIGWWNWFLVILLGLVWVWVVFVGLPRAYYYWDEGSSMAGGDYTMLEPSLAGAKSASSLDHSAVQQRAAAAYAAQYYPTKK